MKNDKPATTTDTKLETLKERYSEARSRASRCETAVHRAIAALDTARGESTEANRYAMQAKDALWEAFCGWAKGGTP